MLDEGVSSGESPRPQSLVPFTEIRDIRTVSIEAHAPEENFSELTVRADIGSPAFRSREGEIQVRLTASVKYFRPEDTDTDEHDSLIQPTLFPAVPVGSIGVTFLIYLDINPDIAVEKISQEQIEDLTEQNLVFMLYPYVRSAIQQISSELRLPPTVLPYMRR